VRHTASPLRRLDGNSVGGPVAARIYLPKNQNLLSVHAPTIRILMLAIDHARTRYFGDELCAADVVGSIIDGEGSDDRDDTGSWSSSYLTGLHFARKCPM
jgi:hypothetical protein